MNEKKEENIKLTVNERIKIKWKIDPFVQNSGIFRITKEDHTVGNIIHYKLLTLKDVIFCAYKKPHPLEHFIILKIITNGSPNILWVDDAAIPLPMAHYVLILSFEECE